MSGEEAPGADDLLRWLDHVCLRERGLLVELGGARSAGRTALAQCMSARVTSHGELVGWVDTANALDPRSLVRAGARIERLLWVRSARVEEALRAAELLQKAGFALVVLDLGGVDVRRLQRMGRAPWTRLQRSARARRSTVLVLSRELPPLGQCFSGASAGLGLVLQKCRSIFEAGLFEGYETRAHVVRRRAGADGQTFGVRLWHRVEAKAAATCFEVGLG